MTKLICVRSPTLAPRRILTNILTVHSWGHLPSGMISLVLVFIHFNTQGCSKQESKWRTSIPIAQQGWLVKCKHTGKNEVVAAKGSINKCILLPKTSTRTHLEMTWFSSISSYFQSWSLIENHVINVKTAGSYVGRQQ